MMEDKNNDGKITVNDKFLTVAREMPENGMR